MRLRSPGLSMGSLPCTTSGRGSRWASACGYDRLGVENVVMLAPDSLVDGRPFTAPANTEQDAAVMREMLGRLRAFARGWIESPPAGSGALVRQSDAAGLRTW